MNSSDHIAALEGVAPVASIVITTRNRRDDTLRAVASCYAQDCPVEVLVYDDCSDDGTADAVRDAFPQARVFESGERTGYIKNRNRGFSDAVSPVVFSIDDDAYFSCPHIVSSTIAVLETDNTIAAIAIPFVEPLKRRSLSSLQTTFDLEAGDSLRSYIGCAHAIRRELALQAGGYREFFVHQGEERDLCIRLQAAGYRIVYGDSKPIVHMVNPKRDADRISCFGARNQIFFIVFNLPFPYVLSQLPRSIIGMLKYRFSFQTLPLKLRAIGSGLFESVRRLRERKAMPADSYAAYRKLSSHGAMPWEGEVPPPCQLKGNE